MLRCTLLSEVGTVRRPSPALAVGLRGLLLVPAAAFALSAAATAGYFGANAVLVLLMAGLVPAALVCWVMASVAGGDWWTAGYAIAWHVVLFVMPGILSAFGVLV